MKRNVLNKNVSARPTKLTSEVLSKLKLLRIVNRFYNARQQHGNQRAQCWEYFGYLFYVAPSEDGLETPNKPDLKQLIHRTITTNINFSSRLQLIWVQLS